MSLHQVTVQQPVRGGGKLEVDAGADLQRSKVGAAERFRHDIGKEDGAGLPHDRQAAAVDCNAGTAFEPAGRGGMIDSDPRRTGFD